MLICEPGIGLELIEREISLILISEINDELIFQEDKWKDRDEEWNVLTGQNPDYVEIEPVEPYNVFQGHRPSLVQEGSTIDQFPNISVMVYQGRPGTSIIDQASNFSITADIETFVKGQNEYEVNARNHRTTEAIHQVLTKNEHLNGLSVGWDNDPIVSITDTFLRKENISQGDNWFWSGARIRYTLNRHTKLP